MCHIFENDFSNLKSTILFSKVQTIGFDGLVPYIYEIIEYRLSLANESTLRRATVQILIKKGV
jgi:hypothetical protein